MPPAIDFEFTDISPDFDGNALDFNFENDDINFEFTEISPVFDGNALDFNFVGDNTGGDTDPVITDPDIALPDFNFSPFYNFKTSNNTASNHVVKAVVSPNKTTLKSFAVLINRSLQNNKSYRLKIGSFTPNAKYISVVTNRFNANNTLKTIVWARNRDIEKNIVFLFDEFISLNVNKKILIGQFKNLDSYQILKWGQVIYPLVCEQLYIPTDGGQLHFDFKNAKPTSLHFNFDSNDNPYVCNIKSRGQAANYPNSFPIYNPQYPKNLIQDTYMTMHDIKVVVLPQRQVIEVDSIKISSERDSFTRTLTLGVISGIEAIKPSFATNQLVEINFDGHVYVFQIYDYTENKGLNGARWTATGQSKINALSQSIAVSATYTSTLLASQIIETELSGTGFTLDYQNVNWLVTANAFSYQNLTKIQAIKKIVDAIGGVILPHRTEKSFIVRPRYQISPWHWYAVTSIPVATLTEDVMFSSKSSWLKAPDINAVHVGGNTVGVSCFVKRTGTAGDKLSAEIVDNLITHADAGREKGRQVISDRGSQQIVTLELPILPVGQVPGIYDEGDLIEIIDPSGTWRGVIIGLSIDISINNQDISLSQTLSIERHYGT